MLLNFYLLYKICRKTGSGFQLWLDAKEESLREANPDVEDLKSLAEKEFNNLTKDEQEVFYLFIL